MHMEASTSPPALKRLFDNFSTVVAVVSTAALSLSIVYDWAFFHVIDPALLPLLTLQDHLAGAVEWLPLTVLAYLTALLVDVYTHGTLSQVRIRTWKSLRWSAIGGVALIVIHVLTEDWRSPQGYAWPLLMIWPWLYAVTLGRTPFFQQNLDAMVALSVVVFFTVIAATNGAASAYEVRRGFTPLSTLRTEKGVATQVRVLRNVASGVIYLDEAGGAHFRPWADVQDIETPVGKMGAKPSLVCRWTHLCRWPFQSG
jgi:hypothetical protein